jgi:hypothetical protein
MSTLYFYIKKIEIFTNFPTCQLWYIKYNYFKNRNMILDFMNILIINLILVMYVVMYLQVKDIYVLNIE